MYPKVYIRMLGRGARGSLPGGGGGGSRGGYGRGRGRGGRFGGRGNPLHTGGGGRGGSGGGQWTGRKSKDELDAEESALEASLGFEAYTEGPARLGWLMNMSSARATPPPHLLHARIPAWDPACSAVALGQVLEAAQGLSGAAGLA